jgi:hypothetical protein
MVLPHFAVLYSMAINLRSHRSEVKRESTTSCGSLHTKHYILRKYSCLQKFTWQGPLHAGRHFPPSIPPDIHPFPTGIPQAFAQRETAKILNVSRVSPHGFRSVFRPWRRRTLVAPFRNFSGRIKRTRPNAKGRKGSGMLSLRKTADRDWRTTPPSGRARTAHRMWHVEQFRASNRR